MPVVINMKDAYLGIINEGAQITDDAARPLLGVAGAVSEAPADDGRDEGQAGCIHSVDEGGVEQHIQRLLGMLVGVGDGCHELWHQLLHLWVLDDRPNLHASMCPV